MTALDQLKAADFLVLTGQPFDLHVDGRVLRLVLDEVKVLGHRRPDASRDPFSLLFQGPPGVRIPQGVHRMSNPAAGPLEIFITQVGGSAAGSLFEAIFT